MPVALSPSTIASTCVGIDEGTDAAVAVRRDRRRFLLRWGLAYAGIAILVAILPMCAVIWRREPAYFTNSIVVIALILAVAILTLGLLGSFLWTISKSGRRHFDEPFICLDATGIRMRVDDVAHTLPWGRITAIHLVGPADRTMAVMATSGRDAESVTPAVRTNLRDEVVAVEPPPGEADYAAPRSDWRPTKADFDAIITADDRSATDDDPPAEVSAKVDDTARASEAGAASRTSRKWARHNDDHWRQMLYGTPYIVQLRGCKPSLSEIAPIVRSLSGGRILVPVPADDPMTRLWRSIVRAR